MVNDKWGQKEIYPTKSGGFEYFQSDDITKDSHFSDEGHVKDSSGGQWTMSTSGPDAVQFAKNDCCEETVTDGCNMDFDKVAARGYGYHSDDPRDVEVTFLIKFVSSGSDNGFAIEGPTGSHSSSGCCSGFCYKLDIQYRPDKPIFRYRKEMYHVSNHTDPKTGEFTDPSNKLNYQLLGHGSFTGFKYIRYNKAGGAASGHNTNDSVVLELWANIHPDTDGTDWFLVKRTEDKGGWGDDGDHCNGDKDQIGSFSMPKFRLKSNDEDGEFDFKHLSMREINPLGSFTDNPDTSGGTDNPNTDPTQVTGQLALRYDINVYRTNPCAPGGSVIFYSSPLDDQQESWVFHADTGEGIIRDRIGIWAKNSSSTLCNQPPLQQVDFYLFKVGSPTGTLTVRIRNINNTIKATMGTLDVSTLSTSPTPGVTSFINLSNTYVMVAGDYILAEFSDGDASNHVRMCKRQSLSGRITRSGIDTLAVYYDFAPEPNVWHVFTDREIPGKLWN